MGGELILPEGTGQLVAPAAAARANEVRKRTLVPALHLVGHVGGPVAIEPKHCAWTQRNYHRILHVMAKDHERPLCGCKPPADYPRLYGLGQVEHQHLVETDRGMAQWHRLMWCNACTTFAGTLTRRAA
jgi:hypothetical protein